MTPILPIQSGSNTRYLHVEVGRNERGQKLRRETKYLLNKGINSLIISVDAFNSSHDDGRVTAVLLMFDHAFEMLLKAALVQRGGDIKSREETEENTANTKSKTETEGNTIGFVDCVNKALSDGNLKFLRQHQNTTLLEIHSLRNAEQHYLVEISEQKLYLTVQVGFTIFKDILRDVFAKDLADCLPTRVLPVSTTPMVDIHTIFQDEVESIRQLLLPGKRQRVRANARLRSLAIMEKSLQCDPENPSAMEIKSFENDIRRGKSWQKMFPGVALIQIERGSGTPLDLRITKRDGNPIHFVKEGEPNDGIAYARNDSDFYSMNLTQLCNNLDSVLNITRPKCSAIVWYLDLQSDKECFKPFSFGKSTVHKMYSPNALARIRKELPDLDLDEVWQRYKNRNR